MELKEATKKILQWAGIANVSDLPSVLMHVALKNDVREIDKYTSFFGSLKIDWLQKCYQFYMADRGKGSKQQDYTPAAIQALLAAVAAPAAGTVYDCCAGSGALTIALHQGNKKLKFVCEELDENVIPFLIFNLVIRNIDAVVLQGDVLKNKIFKAWKLTPTQKYSLVEPLDGFMLDKYESTVSNPPYNICWEPPDIESLFTKDERFSFGVPPAGNANYAFVQHCLYHTKPGGITAMILPNGCTSPASKQEKEIIQRILDRQLLDSVIILPGKMFESTDISTCIMRFCKESHNCMMVDTRTLAVQEIREQRGEGSKSHTERIYKRAFNTFDAETLWKIVGLVETRKDENGIAKCASYDAIRKEGYKLSPNAYISFQEKTIEHRKYIDIITDLNRVIRAKGALKLTINKTTAEQIGIGALVKNAELLDADDSSTDQINSSGLLQALNLPPLEKNGRWLTISKDKNVIKIENMSKEGVSSIMLLMMPRFMAMLKQHIYYLNNEENRLLAEFRDAILPELMSGKIKLPQDK